MAASDYYNHSTFPATGATLSSASMRAELEAVETGISAKLPDLGIANAGKVVAVNAGGTALEAVAAGSVTVADAAGDTTTWPILAGSQTGAQSPLSDAGLTYNASTNTLTTTTFVGALTGTASGNLTSGGALGTPSSGTLTNCTGLPVNGIVDDTTSALGVGSIELGHATANTLTASGGVLSIESVAIPTISSTHTLTNKTWLSVKDTVYTITDGAAFEIDPANGGVQVVTLGASRTPAATNFAAGQSMTLMVADGTAYTITWTTVNPTWVGGSAPALATTGYTVIELWKVGSTIYAAHVGNV